jgi:uncharacterized membrane protein YhaH (DUF805 family)
MISYFTLAYKKYAEFSGRSTRSEYWYFYLAYFIITIILSLLSSLSDAVDIVLAIFALATLIPYLAVTVRRMHDIGKSGWNILWNLLPIIGTIYFIVLLCTKSQEGDNKYGPNPWGQGAAATPVQPTVTTSETPTTPVQ